MPEGPDKPKEKLIAEDEVQAAIMIGKLSTGELTEVEVEGVMIHSRTELAVLEDDDNDEAVVVST